MNKSEVTTDFFNSLSELENVDVKAMSNQSVTKAPAVRYRLINRAVETRQGYTDKFVTYYFLVFIYGKNSVQCTDISDNIDSILLPKGYIESAVNSGYDVDSQKWRYDSVYQISIDDNGYSYAIL